MAVFDRDADLRHDLDFRLVVNTFVTLFRRMEILERTTGWLVEHGYDVVRLDASRWTDDAELHRDVSAALRFPDYYGRNLDALNDCMRDVVDYEYGTSPQATGLVLVLVGYDGFAGRCPRTAQTVLDIFADRARGAALIGHRMMCLVQSDDPHIQFAPVGAMSVLWNDAEWSASERDPGD